MLLSTIASINLICSLLDHFPSFKIIFFSLWVLLFISIQFFDFSKLKESFFFDLLFNVLSKLCKNSFLSISESFLIYIKWNLIFLTKNLFILILLVFEFEGELKLIEVESWDRKFNKYFLDSTEEFVVIFGTLFIISIGVSDNFNVGKLFSISFLFQ